MLIYRVESSYGIYFERSQLQQSNKHHQEGYIRYNIYNIQKD